MKYDPETQRLTLTSGHVAHREVVEAVMGDVFDGRAVTVLPSDDEGKFWYIARSATDVDGRPIVAKKRVGADRLVKRLDRVFASWGQRKPPEAAGEGCSYPVCACRPPVGGGPVACVPRTTEAADMGLAPADDIAPPCGACGLSIRVSAGEDQSGSRVFKAVCSDPDCDWRAVVVVATQVLTPKPVPLGGQ